MLKNIYIKHREKSLILADQLIVSGANFIISIVLAKKLGVDGYGTFAVIQVIQLFIASFHQSLVIAPLISLLPTLSNGKDKNRMYSTLLAFNILLILLVLLIGEVAYFLSDWFQFEELINLLTPTLFYISSIVFYEFIRKMMLVNNKHLILIILNIVAYVLPLIGIILFPEVVSAIEIILYVFISGLMLSILIGLVVLKQCFSIALISKRSFISSWSFSKWLFGKSIVQWLSGNYFIIVAGVILGKQALGVIRIVQNLFGVFNVLLVALENYLAIKSSTIYTQGGPQSLVRFQKDVLLKLTLFLITTLGLVCFSSKFIIVNLYGMEYVKYHFIVYLFSILYIVIFLNLPSRFILRTINKTSVIFFSYLGCTLFSLVFAKLIVSSFGIAGVVIGLIICQLIILCWNQYKANRLIKLDI